jgi:predicted permease
MIESFLTVSQQVLMLFTLMGVGFLLGKLKLLNAQGSLCMSNLMLYAVIPCLVVSSFQRPLETEHLQNFGLTILLSLVVHIAMIAVSAMTLRHADADHRSIYSLCAVMANCGFMAFPLQSALYGSLGVFYGSGYMVIFNICTWTYALYMAAGCDRSVLKLRTVLLNPTIISLVLALALYLAEISLPDLLLTPIGYISSLNVPLPMIIIGFHLSQADLKTALQGRGAVTSIVLRLIVSPLLAMALCLLLGLEPMVSTVVVIAAATPAAAVVTMLVSKFGKNAPLSSSLVSIHTLCSAVTIPVMVALTQLLIK